MRRLQWWFRLVGVFYVVLGIGFFPPLNEARLPLMLTIDVPTNTVVYRSLIDWMFAFGLDLLFIGGFLLYASREPLKNRNLVWLVVWFEAVRGVIGDVYFLGRGIYSTLFFVGFIVIHLSIAGTGVAFLRRAEAANAA